MLESASRGEGVCSGGCLLGGGLSTPGGCLLWGVPALGGGCLLRGGGVSALGGGIPACTEADTTPREQNDKQVQKYYLDHNFVAAAISHIICDAVTLTITAQTKSVTKKFSLKSEGLFTCDEKHIDIASLTF